MAATRKLRPADGIRAASYRILLGLLASTGIRIGEALRCEIGDVDLRSGVLTIRKSKGITARAVPLHSTPTRQLDDYFDRRPAYLANPFETRLLIGDAGTPLEYWAVQNVFRHLRRRAGLGGKGRGQPRIHDLRHTYACRRLVAWQREGVDLNRAMSRLSAYMGHVQPTDTYWYVSIVPELLDNGSRRFEQFANGKGDGK
jgi:integrase